MNKNKIIRVVAWIFVVFCICKGIINTLEKINQIPTNGEAEIELISEMPNMKHIVTKSPFKIMITNYQDFIDNNTRFVRLSLTYENISNKKQPSPLHDITLKDSTGKIFVEDRNLSNINMLNQRSIESEDIVYTLPKDAVIQAIYVDNNLTWEIIK
ncbi:hypothetical protein [Paenibacillus kyungheensis]